MNLYCPVILKCSNLLTQATIMKDVIIFTTTIMQQEQSNLEEVGAERNDLHLVEEQRLSREKERIDLENSYTHEEEKTLSEQTLEMEKTINLQMGDTLETKALLESQRGMYLSYLF